MAGIRWLATADEVDLGYWVLFARGLTPADLLTRLGLDVDPGQVLTREEADDLADETDDVVVRAGASAGWAYAFVEGGPAGPDALDAVRRLSTGAEAVDLWRTVNADRSLGYAEDGRIVCRFEPGREHERTGADPDRLAGAMREAGLRPWPSPGSGLICRAPTCSGGGSSPPGCRSERGSDRGLPGAADAEQGAGDTATNRPREGASAGAREGRPACCRAPFS